MERHVKEPERSKVGNSKLSLELSLIAQIVLYENTFI